MQPKEDLREGSPSPAETHSRGRVDKLRAILFEADLDFAPRSFSGAVTALTGCHERDFLSGKLGWQGLVHPTDRFAFREWLRVARENQTEIPDIEYRILVEGELRWVRQSVHGVLRRERDGPLLQGLIVEVTQQKLAEEALRSREEDLLLLLQSTGEGLFAMDCEARCTLVNPAGLGILGYPDASKLAGQNIHDLVHHSTESGQRCDPEHCPIIIAMREARGIYSDNDVFWRADGTPFPVEYRSHPIIKQGQVVGAVVAFSDVTARKRTERQLRRERERAQQYLDIAGVALLALDPSGCITLINRRGAGILGYPVDALIGKNWFEMCLPAEERERVWGIFQELMAGHRELAEYAENNVLTCQGERRVIAWRNVILRNEDRQIVGTLSSGEDVTDRKQAEAALGRTLMEQEALLNTIPAPVYFRDTTLRIVATNRAFAHFAGLAMDEIVGKTDADLFSRELADTFLMLDQAVLRDGQPAVNVEQRVTGSGGTTLWWSMSRTPLRGPDGHILGVVGINVDITEHKHSEARLQASLQEKEVLLREIHHRVKNNLQVISSLLALEAGRHLAGGEQDIFRDTQDRIRAMAMVHDMLYQSRNLSRIDAETYLVPLVEGLRQAHGVDPARVSTRVTSESIAIPVDTAIPLGLAVTELVTNALKHAFPSGREGTIAVELRHAAGGCVEVIVSDDGIGLPAEDSAGKGGGLGLQIVRALITRQLRGNLSLEARAGTCYAITFPLAGDETAEDGRLPSSERTQG